LHGVALDDEELLDPSFDERGDEHRIPQRQLYPSRSAERRFAGRGPRTLPHAPDLLDTHLDPLRGPLALQRVEEVRDEKEQQHEANDHPRARGPGTHTVFPPAIDAEALEGGGHR